MDAARERIETHLRALGWRPDLLPERHKRELDEQGFTVFPGLIEQRWLERLRERFYTLIASEAASAGSEFAQEKGAPRLSNLVNKGPVFDGMYTHPMVLACVYHVIGRDFKISSLNARDALPGQGQQGLHADWGSGYDGSFHVCNSIWLLDEFTKDNGCTVLAPGSHREKRRAHEGHQDYADKLVHLVAPAGTVAVFNSHTWHGGTQNRTADRSRRAMHCYFTAREHGQQTDQSKHLLYETWKRISPAARYILDVDVEAPAAQVAPEREKAGVA